MTAQKSTNNFMPNLLFRLKSNRKTSIVNLVLHLFSAPMVLIVLIKYYIDKIEYSKLSDSAKALTDSPYFNEAYVAIAFIATSIAVLTGVIFAFDCFNYLHKKSNVDMYMALPLTAKQRFFSDFSAGLISYLAPFLISTVFTTILSFIAEHFMKKAGLSFFHEIGNIYLQSSIT